MDVTAELTRLSGLQQLQAIFAGKTGYAGMVNTLDLHPVSAEEGFVCLRAQPGKLSSPGKNRTPHRNDLIGRIAR